MKSGAQPEVTTDGARSSTKFIVGCKVDLSYDVVSAAPNSVNEAIPKRTARNAIHALSLRSRQLSYGEILEWHTDSLTIRTFRLAPGNCRFTAHQVLIVPLVLPGLELYLGILRETNGKYGI